MYNEDDSSGTKHTSEFESPKENGEHNIVQENKLLSTNFTVEIEKLKAHNLFLRSTNFQIQGL